MLPLLRTSLKHYVNLYGEEYKRARRLRVIVGLLSAISTALTFVSIFATVRIPVAATWLPYLLWGTVAVCLLLLLMLGFIVNYTGHIRIANELNETHQKAVDDLTASHESEIANLKGEHKQIADNLSTQIRFLQREIAESERLKVICEISTKIWESTVLLTDPGNTSDWRDATGFFLEAKLFIRYRNDDAASVLINDFKLSIP